MGKASRRNRAAERPPAAPSWPEPPTWAGGALAAVAGAGALLSAIATYVHHRLRTAGDGYTSFCNLGATFDCDSVLSSSYATLLGLPVSIWGLGFYGLLLVTAVRIARGSSEHAGSARADALALSIGGAAFSAYLGVVSIASLGTLCVLCSGLYVTSAAALVLAWVAARPLPRAIDLLGARGNALRRRPAVAGAAVLAIVAIVLIPQWLGAPTRLSRDEVFRSHPEFFDWYTSRTVVDPPASGGVEHGSADAPVTIVEFADFECGHCSKAHALLKDLLSRYPDDVRYVFHHYPLSSKCNPAMTRVGHGDACGAAAAAVCAADQDRFSAFADKMFRNQTALTRSDLERYAGEVDLDSKRFVECLDGAEAEARVRQDVEAGRRIGVKSTPTFVINGRLVEGLMPFESWILALSLELDGSGSTGSP